MLRITAHEKPELLTFQLEGKLAGPWVQEFERCWRSTVIGRDRSSPAVRVDLEGVTSIDGHGRELLRAMYAQGAELLAVDCLTIALVGEIKKQCSEVGSQRSEVRSPEPMRPNLGVENS
jgi:hypothetical protein